MKKPQPKTSQLAELLAENERLTQQVNELKIELAQHTEIKPTATEQRLREERNRLRTLIDNLPDLIYYKDVEGRFLMANEAVRRYMGLSSIDELIGKNDFELFSSDAAEKYSVVERELFKSGQAKVGHLEQIYDHGSQSNRWVATTKIPFRDENGDVAGLVGLNRDITEFMEIQERFKLQNAILAAQNEASPDGILVVSAERIWTSFNQRFLQMWGIPEEISETVQSQVALQFVLDSLVAPQEFLDKVTWLYENPQEISQDEVALKDGRFFERYSAPIFDKTTDEHFGRVWYFRDITARKRIEAQREQADLLVLESKARYESLFEDSPVSLWEEDFSRVKDYFKQCRQAGITDFQAYFEANPEEVYRCFSLIKIIDVNKATLTLHGSTSKEEFFANLDNLTSEEAWPALIQELVVLSQGHTTFESEIYIKTLGGELRHVLLKLFIPPGYEETWSKVFVSAMDNTDRKVARETLRQANEELLRLNADKDKFFSIVAHDLKGPFMPLLGYLEFLIEAADTLTPAEIKEIGLSTYKAGKRVHDLLENLLQWSQLQMGRMSYSPEKVALAEMVDSNILLLEAAAQAKSITVQSDRLIDVWVQADKNMLNTVIRNLINNALKFTKPGGSIIISTQSNASFIEITVADNGVGMSQNHVDKLFLVETQSSTVGTAEEKGTGLGLILCKEMVERHGGKIWVESELKRGTTVTFTVPLFV